MSHSAGAPAQSTAGLLAVITLAPFVVTGDFAMIGTVLPRIGSDMQLGTAAVSGVVSIYALVYAALLMAGGRLADLWGARPTAVLGLVLLVAATLLVMAAPSATVLLIGRGMQGAGAALISPACLALMNTVVPAGRLRLRVYRLFGSLQGAASIAGPVVGGALATLWGWRAAFSMELGLAALLVFGMRIYVPRVTVSTASARFDVAGALLIALTVVCLVAATAGIGGLDLSAIQRIAAGGIGVLATLALLFVERHTPQPLLPPGLLHNRRLALVTIGLLSAMAGATALFLLPNLLMQNLMGWSSAASGLGMLPHAVLGILGGQLVGVLMGRFALRSNILFAFAMLILALLLYAWLPQPATYVKTLLLPMSIGGVWSLVLMVMLMAESSAVVGPTEQGVASGLAYTATQIGTAISSAVLLTAAASSRLAGAAHALQGAYAIAAGMATVGLWCALALPRISSSHTTATES